MILPLKCKLGEVSSKTEALDSTETIEWKAFAAILDFICPLFGSGLVPLEILSSAAAVTSRTLFIVYIKDLEVYIVQQQLIAIPGPGDY
ncbi:hypothetical protein Peur_003466 [Populus x canadensis]